MIWVEEWLKDRLNLLILTTRWKTFIILIILIWANWSIILSFVLTIVTQYSECYDSSFMFAIIYIWHERVQCDLIIWSFNISLKFQIHDIVHNVKLILDIAELRILDCLNNLLSKRSRLTSIESISKSILFVQHWINHHVWWLTELFDQQLSSFIKTIVIFVFYDTFLDII